MLTVGYGDIVPLNIIEKIYAIMAMLLGCCLFAYVMNSIGGLVDEIQNDDIELRNDLNELNEYLDNKPITEELKLKMRKYIENLY